MGKEARSSAEMNRKQINVGEGKTEMAEVGNLSRKAVNEGEGRHERVE